VQAEPQPDGTMRYRLLEPLRQFAHARLGEAGELEAARCLHARHMVDLAERAGGESAPGLIEQRLNPETDNLRGALEWSLRSGRADLAARLGASLWPWWTRPDRQAEGRAWFRRILAHPHPDSDPTRRGRVAVGLAYMHLVQGDMADAARLAEDVCRIAEEADDDALAAIAASVRGRGLAFLGQSGAAEPVLRESIRRARRAGLDWILILSTLAIGDIALARGDVRAAEEAVHECVRIARPGADPWSRGIALNALGDVMRARGQVERAAAAYEEALVLFESLDPYRKYLPQGLLHNLGYVAHARGDLRRAARLFLDSADGYRAVGTDRRGMVECAIGLARTAVSAGLPILAAQLFGSAEATLEQLGTLLTPANRVEYERGLAELGAALDAPRLAAARAEGRRLGLDEALERARELVDRTDAASTVSSSARPAGLTAREHEVALLVARGLSNRQVADELVITEKTAKNHVQRVLDKLGVRSRTQLVIRARELGLGDPDAAPA
jgi:ATP/maltotriose-dependent transcriptional regulator MalT